MVESSIVDPVTYSPGITIRTLKDLHEVIKKLRGVGPVLYRGQNIDAPLLPRFARKAAELNITNPLTIEKKLITEFIKASLPYLTVPVPATDWDWLSVARHHGLPTRLLDWTEDPEIALWFAVMAPVPKKSKSGILWVLEASQEDFKTPGPTISLFDLKRTFIFQPAYVNKRIASQLGWFTIHKYVEKRNKFIPLEKNKIFQGKLTKFTIPKDVFSSLRDQLEKKGLTRFYLYQDIDSLCMHLESKYLSPLSA